MLYKLVSAVAFVAGAFALDYEREEGVIVLGDDTLAGAIDEFPYLLVEFYAPWCGHCKSLAPEYAKAAQALEANEEIELAKVDATVATKVASEYGVSGYPTLKFFKNGEATDFNGGRTSAEIVAWLEKKTGPAVTTGVDAAGVESLKEANPIVVVLYTSDNTEENKAVKHFNKMADVNDDVKFVLIDDEAVAKELEIEGENSVVLFKQYDEGRVDFDGDKVTKTKLEAFIAPHMLPYVVEFSDDVAQRLFGGDIKEHMLFFRKDSGSDANKAIVDEYREVAKEHQGELIFVTVDMEVDSNSRIAEFFGLADSDYPAVRIINIEGQPVKYAAPEGFELTREGFKNFAVKYLAKELSPSLNSEEIPEDWNSEDLKVLVGKNFKEVALDESKNVMLMAHAPWCGHCKSLMPVFEELAEHFEDDENVIIAKMDSTKNEVTEFSVQGFPTLKFFPSGSSEIIDYEGGRELDNLIEFITANRGDAADADEADDAEAKEEDEEEEKDEL